MNETLRSDPIFAKSWKLALIVLAVAALLRIWGAFELDKHIDDEILHSSTAVSLGAYGTTTEWGWQHPQLSAFIMYGTISLFGDNPVGRRSSNIFFGTASVALLFLIGRLLYPDSAVPLIALSLLALDPHHIYLSRATYVEVPVTFFFLLYLYLLLEYTEHKRQTLPFAGVAMGLTIATKAYFVFSIPLAALYALYKINQRGELTRSSIVDLCFSLTLLPVAIYLLSYFWWFGRGYALTEFVQMKIDSVRALISLTDFDGMEYFAAGGKPWEWFLKPLFWGHKVTMDNTEGIFLIQSNNPPFRLLVLPSLLVIFVYGWKQRSEQDLMIPLLFAGCYALILLAQRPMFSYSVTGMLPFAYLGIARAVSLGALRIKRETLVCSCFLTAVLIWGMYMFPLVSARLVPLAPYRPILSAVRYLGSF